MNPRIRIRKKRRNKRARGPRQFSWPARTEPWWPPDRDGILHGAFLDSDGVVCIYAHGHLRALLHPYDYEDICARLGIPYVPPVRLDDLVFRCGTKTGSAYPPDESAAEAAKDEL